MNNPLLLIVIEIIWNTDKYKDATILNLSLELRCNFKCKSHGLKRELHWLETLDTQFPRGTSHKIPRRRDIFITIPYNSNIRKAFKIMRDIYAKLQATYPNLFKGELVCPYKRNQNLAECLFFCKVKVGFMSNQSRLMLQVKGHPNQPRMASFHNSMQSKNVALSWVELNE